MSTPTDAVTTSPPAAPTRAPAAEQNEAARLFSLSIVISGTRCLLTYIVFPWVLPVLGIAGGVGPAVGVIVGVVAIVFITCVLLPVVVTLCARFLRRSHVRIPDAATRESADRLARLEQAIDAIAVEVERVSEGQRFVTRLLADSRQQTEQTPALHEYRPN